MRSMQKKQEAFVGATSEAGGRESRWVVWCCQSSAAPRSARETRVAWFYFCRDLASASLVMEQPKGGEAAQRKGHP